MNLIRWKPGELYSLRRNMDRMFDSLWNQSEDGEGTSSAIWTPSVDISETEHGYVISADLPGMNKEDFDISFANGRLAISGERKAENRAEKDNVHRIERLYGRAVEASVCGHGRFHTMPSPSPEPSNAETGPYLTTP